MLFAMTEVVFEVVTVIFEHIDVLILHFPARAADLNDFGNFVGDQAMIGDPGIMEQKRACLLVGDGQFTPVDQEGSGTSA